MGSSPQVRGTSSPSGAPARSPGLIPAGAGNIAARTCASRASRAHPRRCGEHPLLVLPDGVAQGSSPQVRGTWVACLELVQGLGLIPAGAGNMTHPQSQDRAMRAHPRRCGEHSEGIKQDATVTGSSPQVRGTFARRCAASTLMGLIPAGAGNIVESQRTRLPPGAHPRRCGEHNGASLLEVKKTGSSPQVRGTSGDGSVDRSIDGLIPAGAGNISAGP